MGDDREALTTKSAGPAVESWEDAISKVRQGLPPWWSGPGWSLAPSRPTASRTVVDLSRRQPDPLTPLQFSEVRVIDPRQGPGDPELTRKGLGSAQSRGQDGGEFEGREPNCSATTLRQAALRQRNVACAVDAPLPGGGYFSVTDEENLGGDRLHHDTIDYRPASKPSG
jgi:hypothetical protein